MATPALKSYEARIDCIDHAGKRSFITFRVSAADYTAWNTDTTAGNVRDTMDAYEALTVDNIVGESVSEKSSTAPVVPTIPASEQAVNSAKLQVLWIDTVNGDSGSNTIPARDAGNYTSVRGQVITGGTGTAAVQALVTAIEANQKSDLGNPIAVKEIRVVGRGTAA